jgi:sugar transferase (PEP-CTERM/EpsH1 system associated)
MRIKIAHVLDNFHLGGLQNGVVNVINGLDQERFVHTVCCITHLGDSRFKVRRSDVTYHELQKGPANDVYMPFKLARIFRKEKPHIVHTRNWGAIDGIFGALLAMVPIIVHSEHGRDTSYMNSEPRRRVLMRKFLFRTVDLVFTVSEELRTYFHRLTGFAYDKIRVVPNGVDLQRFDATSLSLGGKRKEIGLKEDDFVIGCVGRLDPVKDHLTLLKSFAALATHYERLRLVIVGDGPLRQDLEIYVRDNGLKGKALLLGARRDVTELLRLMDVFVLPSLSEGMSNTLLEAMACGRAIIASNAGGNPQLISGKSGLLFPVRDSAALSSLIQQLIRAPERRVQLGSAARKRAEAEFSLDAMIDRYASLYINLMEKKGWSGNPSKSNVTVI